MGPQGIGLKIFNVGSMGKNSNLKEWEIKNLATLHITEQKRVTRLEPHIKLIATNTKQLTRMRLDHN